MKVRFFGFSLMSLGLVLSGGLMELLHHTEYLRPSRNPWAAVLLTVGPMVMALAGWLQFVTGKRLREIECASGAKGCLMTAAVMLATAVFLAVVIAVGARVGILRPEYS